MADMDDFKREFLEEARELLEKAGADILQAEANPDDKDVMHSIFRSIHTVKGNAGTFEVDVVASFAHHLEGLLDALRKNQLELEPDIADLILSGIDRISLMLNAFANDEEPVGDDELVAQFCDAYQQNPDTNSSSSSPNEDNAEMVIPIEFMSEADNALASAKTFLDELKVDLKNRDLLDDLYTEIHVIVAGARMKDLAVIVTVGGELEKTLARLKELDSPENLPLAELQSGLERLSTTLTAVGKGETVIIEPATSPANQPAPAETAINEAETNEIKTDDNETGMLLPVIDEEDIAAFLSDAVEHIEVMERAVINYEKSGCRDSLDELSRGAHTIKGDADYLQLEITTGFAHVLESLLVRLRQDELIPDSEIIDLLLAGIDGLKYLINEFSKGETVHEFPAGYEKLAAMAGEDGITITDTPANGDELANLPEDMREVFLDQVMQHKDILAGHSKPPLAPEDREIITRSLSGLERASSFVDLPTLKRLLLRAQELLKDDEASLLTAIGEIVSFIDGLTGDPKPVGEILVADGKISNQDLSEALEQQKPLGKILMEQGKVSKQDLSQALAQQKPVGEILVDQGKVATAEVHQALKKQGLMEVAQTMKPRAIERETHTMRVDELKIEEFSNLVGELLVARNSYEYLINNLGNINGAQELAAQAKSLKENLHLFTRLVGNMHHGVMAMRMIPIRGIFQKYTRVVRDVARKQKKEIQLILKGEDTEVDKKVADTLSEPLIHLVRNACDHGIESPTVREAAGKAKKGTVTLSASQLGSNLIIQISDDGAGIDKEKLVAKAMNSGIDVDGMDEAAVLGLIFHAGLSTMDQATNISGRGVGMDVVRSTIDSLNGHLQLSSNEGTGTELSMTIPMTMGIIVILLIEANGQSYGLPFEHVLETIKILPSELRKAGDGLIFHYRGQVIEVDFLENRLAQPDDKYRDRDCLNPAQEISLVILKIGSTTIGFIVDRFVRNMEMAVKPLPPTLAHIEEISGASIMGDGRLILLLNTTKL
ncbi:MAG: Hpt domain-containing protein [Candidatus Desulfofervidaceae bacterium]|nr:Hpt domain-containing protein [Candidatus Desulfofervidaceae bacterium]